MTDLPISQFYYRPGSAWIDGADIVFGKPDIADQKRWRNAAALYPMAKKSTLLEEFVRLVGSGNDDRVCEFAKRYGPLWGLSPMGGEREPLEWWRRWAEWAKVILAIKNKLQDGKRVSKDEWEAVGVTTQGPPRLQRKFHAKAGRSFLAHAVNGALDIWQVRPGIYWATRGEVPRFELHCRTLIGAIGAQLIFEVCNSNGLYFCSSCNEGYRPLRKPRDGENHFCQECGRLASCKLAQRRRRQRIRKSEGRGK